MSEDTPQDTRSVAELVAEYTELETQATTLELSIADKVARMRAEQAEIINLLDFRLAQAGTTSMRTPNGTAVRTTRSFYRAVDAAVFKQWAAAAQLWDSFTVSPTAEFVKEYQAANNNALPPGVGVHVTTKTTIRKTA